LPRSFNGVYPSVLMNAPRILVLVALTLSACNESTPVQWREMTVYMNTVADIMDSEQSCDEIGDSLAYWARWNAEDVKKLGASLKDKEKTMSKGDRLLVDIVLKDHLPPIALKIRRGKMRCKDNEKFKAAYDEKIKPAYELF
jgi:hypothetical protein